MRTFIAVVAALAMQVMQGSAQEPTDPMVQKALEKQVRDTEIRKTIDCDKKSFTEDLDKPGRPKKENVNKERIKMDLPKLFRPGRYVYVNKGLQSVSGHAEPLIEIRFSPTAHPPQLILDPGIGWLDRHYEKGQAEVVNISSGSLYLDPETLGTVKVTLELSDEILVQKYFKFSETKIDVEQQYVFGAWVPRQIEDTVRFTVTSWFIRIVQSSTHEKTTATFENCRQRPPSN